MKKLLTFLLLCTSYFCSSQGFSDSLLIYYPFTDAAADFSGNGFDGFSTATPVEDRFGNPNNAMGFNGINQFIDFPNDPSLKPELPVSFSFWAKFNDLTPSKSVLFTTDFGTDQHSGVWMNAASSTPILGINYGEASGGSSSPDRRSKGGETVLEVGVWYHIAGVVRGPLDMDIYIDCENDGGSYGGSGSLLGYTDNPGSIGRKDLGNTPVYFFDGEIDDFRYWNRAITFDEVRSLCQEITTENKDITPQEKRASIFPNPANTIINIETDFPDALSVEIYNTFGVKIKTTNLEKEIDISSFSTGVYFLKILNKKTQAIQSLKFIKI